MIYEINFLEKELFDMLLAVGVVISGIFFFICCVNTYFQKGKYKYMTKEEIKRYSKFNSPGAWMSYAVAIVIIVVLMFGLSLSNVFNGFSTISTDSDKINAANSTISSSTATSTDSTLSK